MYQENIGLYCEGRAALGVLFTVMVCAWVVRACCVWGAAESCCHTFGGLIVIDNCSDPAAGMAKYELQQTLIDISILVYSPLRQARK